MLRSTCLSSVLIILFIATCCEVVTAQETVRLDSWPVNLAPAAKVSASSELDEHYLARNAVDGKIPFMMEDYADGLNDRDHAWCTPGSKDSSFTFQWDSPVTVKEIVYMGRFHRRRGFIGYSEGGRSENFEKYALYVDDQAKPIFSGKFEQEGGPRRITLPKPVEASKLRFDFEAVPGLNPGAEEFLIFSRSTTDAQLDVFLCDPFDRTAQAEALRAEIAPGSANRIDYPFEKILLVKRMELDVSHVYVYHVEDYRPGGGLYTYNLKV